VLTTARDLLPLQPRVPRRHLADGIHRRLRRALARLALSAAGYVRRAARCAAIACLLVRHDLARAGRVLAADLRNPQHDAVRLRGRDPEPLDLDRDRDVVGLQGRLRRPRADVDQRHVHRHPALPAPRAVLFRDARQDVVAAAGARHGVPRLVLRRAADPLGRDESQESRIHPAERVLRHAHVGDRAAGASARTCCPSSSTPR
jgi:hypothetical protein